MLGFVPLGVERTVSQAAYPRLPGGSVSPADAASPCRTAGCALDAKRPVPQHGEFVRAGECQCCGTLVPAAHRQTSCPLCGSPVVHRLNENAPAAFARSGADNRRKVLMCQKRSAQDALDLAALRSGERSVPAACPGCGDDLDGRMLLVRDHEDGEWYDTLVRDDGTGDGPSIFGTCWACDAELLPDTVILRDRHRRCEREVAELRAVA